MVTTESGIREDADGQIVRTRRRRGVFVAIWIIGLLIVAGLGVAAWLLARVTTVQSEVKQVMPLITDLRAKAAGADAAAVSADLTSIGDHLQAARDASSDPVWRIGEATPVFGVNLLAVREAVGLADDLVDTVGEPLVAVAGDATPASMFRADGSVDLDRLSTIAATVSDAAIQMPGFAGRAADIPTDGLVPQVHDAVAQLQGMTAQASTLIVDLNKASTLAVSMLGSEQPRNYLVLIMNNAELRAQGGMPGFTAAISADHGRIQLVRTASTTDFDPIPAAPVTGTAPWEDALFSSDVARRLQDTTATYDFRDSARYASALAQRIYGIPFDGVLAIDPYVLSYIMRATGGVALANGGELTADNAVSTLLRDTYLNYPNPADQDGVFGGVVDSLMAGLTKGSFEPGALLDALGRSVQEGRVRVWSTQESEQTLIDTTAVDGQLPDPADGAAIGVYANDWTRSKMDYYLDASSVVQDLGCADGRHSASVTVTLTHTLSAEQAAALPEYVTGDGLRVPKGDIGTQVVIVGPAGATVESSQGQSSDIDTAVVTDAAGRPAATRTVTLAPDQTGTATVVVSWPDDGEALAAVTATPQIAQAAFTPSTSGCR